MNDKEDRVSYTEAPQISTINFLRYDDKITSHQICPQTIT